MAARIPASRREAQLFATEDAEAELVSQAQVASARRSLRSSQLWGRASWQDYVSDEEESHKDLNHVQSDNAEQQGVQSRLGPVPGALASVSSAVQTIIHLLHLATDIVATKDLWDHSPGFGWTAITLLLLHLVLTAINATLHLPCCPRLRPWLWALVLPLDLASLSVLHVLPWIASRVPSWADQRSPSASNRQSPERLSEETDQQSPRRSPRKLSAFRLLPTHWQQHESKQLAGQQHAVPANVTRWWRPSIRTHADTARLLNQLFELQVLLTHHRPVFLLVWTVFGSLPMVALQIAAIQLAGCNSVVWLAVAAGLLSSCAAVLELMHASKQLLQHESSELEMVGLGQTKPVNRVAMWRDSLCSTAHAAWRVLHAIMRYQAGVVVPALWRQRMAQQAMHVPLQELHRLPHTVRSLVLRHALGRSNVTITNAAALVAARRVAGVGRATPRLSTTLLLLPPPANNLIVLPELLKPAVILAASPLLTTPAPYSNGSGIGFQIAPDSLGSSAHVPWEPHNSIAKGGLSPDEAGKKQQPTMLLKLALCEDTPGGPRCLAACLRTLMPHALTHLSLRDVRLQLEAYQVLGSCIADPGCRLRCLTLKEVNFSRVALHHLCTALASNTSVLELDLSSNFLNQLGPKAPLDLRGMLEENCTLTKLNLSYTGLGSEAVAHVLLGAAFGCSLIHLDLSQNHVSDALPYSLLRAYPCDRPPPLARLNMGFNWIQDCVPAWMLLCLSLFPRLTHLWLDHCSAQQPVIGASRRRRSSRAKPGQGDRPSPASALEPTDASQASQTSTMTPCTPRPNPSVLSGMALLAHLYAMPQIADQLHAMEMVDMAGLVLPVEFRPYACPGLKCSWAPLRPPAPAATTTTTHFTDNEDLGWPEAVTLSDTLLQLLQQPGYVMDLGAAPWNALAPSQRLVAIYAFTSSQPRLLITNVPSVASRPTRHGPTPFGMSRWSSSSSLPPLSRLPSGGHHAGVASGSMWGANSAAGVNDRPLTPGSSVGVTGMASGCREPRHSNSPRGMLSSLLLRGSDETGAGSADLARTVSQSRPSASSPGWPLSPPLTPTRKPLPSGDPSGPISQGSLGSAPPSTGSQLLPSPHGLPPIPLLGRPPSISQHHSQQHPIGPSHRRSNRQQAMTDTCFPVSAPLHRASKRSFSNLGSYGQTQQTTYGSPGQQLASRGQSPEVTRRASIAHMPMSGPRLSPMTQAMHSARQALYAAPPGIRSDGSPSRPATFTRAQSLNASAAAAAMATANSDSTQGDPLSPTSPDQELPLLAPLLSLPDGRTARTRNRSVSETSELEPMYAYMDVAQDMDMVSHTGSLDSEPDELWVSYASRPLHNSAANNIIHSSTLPALLTTGGTNLSAANTPNSGEGRTNYSALRPFQHGALRASASLPASCRLPGTSFMSPTPSRAATMSPWMTTELLDSSSTGYAVGYMGPGMPLAEALKELTEDPWEGHPSEHIIDMSHAVNSERLGEAFEHGGDTRQAGRSQGASSRRSSRVAGAVGESQEGVVELRSAPGSEGHSPGVVNHSRRRHLFGTHGTASTLADSTASGVAMRPDSAPLRAKMSIGSDGSVSVQPPGPSSHVSTSPPLPGVSDASGCLGLTPLASLALTPPASIALTPPGSADPVARGFNSTALLHIPPSVAVCLASDGTSVPQNSPPAESCSLAGYMLGHHRTDDSITSKLHASGAFGYFNHSDQTHTADSHRLGSFTRGATATRSFDDDPSGPHEGAWAMGTIASSVHSSRMRLSHSRTRTGSLSIDWPRTRGATLVSQEIHFSLAEMPELTFEQLEQATTGMFSKHAMVMSAGDRRSREEQALREEIVTTPVDQSDPSELPSLGQGVGEGQGLGLEHVLGRIGAGEKQMALTEQQSRPLVKCNTAPTAGESVPEQLPLQQSKQSMQARDVPRPGPSRGQERVEVEDTSVHSGRQSLTSTATRLGSVGSSDLCMRLTASRDSLYPPTTWPSTLSYLTHATNDLEANDPPTPTAMAAAISASYPHPLDASPSPSVARSARAPRPPVPTRLTPPPHAVVQHTTHVLKPLGSLTPRHMPGSSGSRASAERGSEPEAEQQGGPGGATMLLSSSSQNAEDTPAWRKSHEDLMSRASHQRGSETTRVSSGTPGRATGGTWQYAYGDGTGGGTATLLRRPSSVVRGSGRTRGVLVVGNFEADQVLYLPLKELLMPVWAALAAAREAATAGGVPAGSTAAGAVQQQQQQRRRGSMPLYQHNAAAMAQQEWTSSSLSRLLQQMKEGGLRTASVHEQDRHARTAGGSGGGSTGAYVYGGGSVGASGAPYLGGRRLGSLDMPSHPENSNGEAYGLPSGAYPHRVMELHLMGVPESQDQALDALLHLVHVSHPAYAARVAEQRRSLALARLGLSQQAG